MKFLFLLALLLALCFAADLFAAQLVAFGLAYYHVQSGIWGPFLIMMGFGIICAGSAASGRRR